MSAAITPERLERWLRSRDTGLSSEAIFHFMTLGIRGGNTPSDPADLARCLRLLAAFPEWTERLGEMATCSDEWAFLVPHWPDLESSFLDEAGGSLPPREAWWSAPETYAMMKRLEADSYETRGFVVERRDDGSLRSAYRPAGDDPRVAASAGVRS